MGINFERYKDGVLVESLDTRTQKDKDKEDLDEIHNRRKDRYKSIPDQLDMMYWDKINSTTTWEDHISDIKSTHPIRK